MKKSALLAAACVLWSGLAAANEPPPPAESAIRIEVMTSTLDGELAFLLLTGEMALRQGAWSQAVAALSRAAERLAVPEVWQRLAQAALFAQQPGVLRRAVVIGKTLAPDDPAFARLQAHEQQLRERFEAAVAERIAALLQGEPEAIERNLLSLPAALAELDDPAQILRLIRRVARDYPDEPAAALIVSEAARQADELDLAWSQAQRALSLRPDWPPAWAQLAQIAIDRDEAETVIDQLREAHQRIPSDLTIALAYGGVLAEAGEEQDLLALVTSLLDSAAAREERLVTALVQWGKEGLAPEALARQLQRLAKQQPPLATPIQLGLAELWLARAQPQRALNLVQSLTQAQDLATREPALRLVAQALARLGRVKEALSRLETLDPSPSPVALAQREARLWMEAQRFEQARSTLAEALARWEDDPGLSYDYALLLDKIGAREAAMGHLRKLLALRPFDAHALNALGYLLVEADRDLAEAETLLTQALELRPNDGYILDSMGWLRFKQGRLVEARRLLERAWRRSPDEEIGSHLVALYQAMNETERAQRWQQRLQRRFPIR